MKRRHIILLLGGASSGAMSVGTGAFSSMEAERGVEVNVVSDDKAYIGYEASNKTVPTDENDDGTIDLVTVKNRFADDVSISITGVDLTVISQSGEYPDISEDSVGFPTGSFGSGESETITGTVQCGGSSGSATVEITVRVEGGGVRAELFGDTETRRFEIECDPVPTVTGVDFQGSGNAELLVEDDERGSQSTDGDTVDVRVYYVDEDGIRPTSSEPVNTKHKLKDQTSIDGETIAGVHVDGTEGVYVHPQFDKDECDVTPVDGNGNGVSGGEVTTASDPTAVFGGCLADDD